MHDITSSKKFKLIIILSGNFKYEMYWKLQSCHICQPWGAGIKRGSTDRS